MRVRIFLLMTVGFLLAADAPKDDAAKQDRDKLQGSWQVVSAELSGKPEPEEKVKMSRLTITGDKFQLKEGSRSHEGAYKLDPSKKPRAIDISVTNDPAGEKLQLRGIYLLEGDMLKLCWRKEGKERPTEFASKQDADLVLLVLKRAKP